MSDAKALALQEKLQSLSRPRLAKCLPSRRERGEERAAACFAGALHACGLSQRAAARWLLVDERIVRDWAHGARAVPGWAVLALPRDGQIAFLQLAANDIPESDESDDDTEQERRSA